ncbi:MAG: alpha-amylase family glycosyl hydrolase [Myxococcales bacterium]|nr:alpha-amylase family glycosyl hydrolase [Myxococcales bacterium]
MASRVPVTFVFRGAPGQRVELFGDLPSWDRPHLMPEVEPGLFKLTLELDSGLYRYKFLVDWKRWVRDAHAPVDWTEGVENSVVIVDGTRPPLFFACDRRHLLRAADGVLRVHFEVEAGARAPTSVWLRTTELHWGEVTLQGTWRGRHFFSASLAVPAKATGTWGFEGSPEHVFPLPAPQAASAHRPAWAKGAVWYGIFLDRWHRAGAAVDERVSSRDTPTSATTFYGGDLDGVRASLPSLAALGVDGVVLTPVQPSETPHRYDTTDHLAIDARLGGAKAMKALITEAHRLGLKLAADVSFTHVHEAHPFWRDVLRRQRRSAKAAWFQVRRFPVRRSDPTSYASYANRPELPLLDLTNPAARAHVIGAAVAMVKLGVDALRLDAMTDAPAELWSELRAAVKRVRKDVTLLGEVVMDAQPNLAEDLGADALTDFQHREALIELLQGRMSAAHFAGWTRFLEHRQGPLPRAARLRFLDNHDTSRIGSLVNPEQARLALTYLLLRPEPAWLTYGTEFELAAHVPLSRLDDAWPERLPMPPPETRPPVTHALITTLLELRRLLRDEDVQLDATGAVLSFQRTRADGAALTVALNCSDTPQPMDGGEVLLAVNETPTPAAPLGPWCARVVLRRDD